MVVPLAVVSLSIMKPISETRAAKKETKPAAKSTFAMTSQLYHDCVGAFRARSNAGANPNHPLASS